MVDGHTEFVAADGHRVESPAHHDVFDVAAVTDRDAFSEHLRRHAEGQTSYVQLSCGLAASGVHKWVADTSALTMTYMDRSGAVPLIEQVG